MPSTPSPDDRLRAACLATKAGRYEEALREFVWFHEHVLEEDRGYYGVRLSFALMYWMELGKVYPEAAREMERIRDRKTETILRGEGNFHLVHDVVALNRTLGSQGQTHTLFARLAIIDPVLARECVSIALSAIVGAGDFALASSLLPDPEAHLTELCARFAASFEYHRRMPRTRAPAIRAISWNHGSSVKVVLDFLKGLGRHEQAAELRASVLNEVRSSYARKAVRDAIDGVVAIET